MSLDDQLENYLLERHKQNLYRTRSVRQNHQAAYILFENRKYLNFCSNDYLGLASHHEIIFAAQSALQEYGVGSGASALITGHTKIHQQLEESLAEFTCRSKVLLFSNGFAANIGVLGALANKKTNLIMDKLSHASLIDGAKLSGSKLRRYQHLDMHNLERLLENKDPNEFLVVTESLFSMDGDLAPLNEISDICKKNSANAYVDDAHGFGVYGENGAGSLTAAGLNEQQIPVMVATFGKAFGAAGAFVAGSEILIETLVQKARSYIYSTAMPPAMAAAILKSLELVKKDNWRREKLFDLVTYFREKASARGIPISENALGPIQPIMVGDSDKALKHSQLLEEKGIKISAIRPPTVPENTSRLRITFSAAHEKQHIDSLVSALGDVFAV
ncbi:MAG: 8-amino-7-oxononanoate synthase [Gammaproteobacteria bacterium]